MRKTLLASAVVAALFVHSVRAEHPVQERGFRADGVYHLTGIDSVNLFNGNVNLVIPIGQTYRVSSSLSHQLTLRYAGAAWKYFEHCMVWPGGQEESCRTNAGPIHENGGFGWELGFGELTAGAPSAYARHTGYVYESPDGSEHHFYPILHDGDAEDAGDTAGTAVTYTRDGSYLRMKVISTTTRVIEFPDGQKQRFTLDATDNKWYLRHIYNGFSSIGTDSTPTTNYIAYTYPANATYAGVKDVVITDSAGRTYAIRFKDAIGGPSRIASVELPKFKGGSAVYTFEYLKNASGGEGIVIGKPVDVTGTVTTATVALLSKVNLPNGESFQFTYATPTTMDPESGRMQQMILPTLGKVEWDYAAYSFAVDAPYDQAVGVSARRIYGYSKAALPQYALEQYTTYVAGGASNTIQAMVGWTDNLGTSAKVDFKTVHHFQTGNGPMVGLPFATFSTDSAGRHLSTETYDCNPTTGVCTKERASYVKYENDDVDSCDVSGPCLYDRNRRAYTENTIHVTDGNRNASVDHVSFDGLGHYRQSTTGGNFGKGDVRLMFTAYNDDTRAGASVGNYLLDANGNRAGTFLMLNATDPWVLGTSTWQRVEEGGVKATVQTCFDKNTSFLLRKRALKNGLTAGVNDLVSIYTPDSGGNFAREEHFGGDGQTVSTGALCGMVLPAHGATSFRIDHTYQYGSLIRSQYKDTAGGTTGGLGFYPVDVDVDLYTGLPTRSRDAAGIYTDLEFDSLGRLTWTKPQPGHGAWTQYDYRLAASLASGRAQVAVYQRPNGSTTGVLARNSVEYDGFGRVYRENQLLADGWWNTTDVRYDHAGRKWKVSSTENWVSDTASPSNWTTTTYDAYGRPLSVTTPDGKATTFAYTGGRVASRTQQVGISASGNVVTESGVTTTEEYDRQGRVWKITEAAGSASAVATEYSYDVGGRLSKVCSGASSGVCTQTRLFNYDLRGLLTSEQHPEKGISGNGSVSYTYDAGGHLLTRTEGTATANFSLSYVYDRAERLTQVKETNRSGRVVKQYTYGSANGTGVDLQTSYKKGRLESATRTNYDRTGIGFDAAVTETYEYTGVGGRVSRKVTDVRNGATVIASFDQRGTWNELGSQLSTTYPDCTAPASCAGSDPARTVSNTYTNGFLTAVPGHATSISYHPNGMVNTVAHANGLSTVQAIHANAMARPDSFLVKDSANNVFWTTAGYAYDGAGNIKNTGWNYYVYDRLGRVTEGSAEYVSPTNGKLQRTTYDAFGNMLSMTTLVNGATTTTRTMGAVAATNRLCTGAMCSSGNLGLIDYDDGGNLRYVNGKTYTFDSHNMMATLSDGPSVNYVYTVDDERIWAYTNSPSTSSRWSARGLDGKVLREYTTTGTAGAQTWSFAKDYIYRGSNILSSVSPTGAVTQFHLDHLGSTRLTTDASRNVLERTEYFPFGQESATPGPEMKKFTGHERDYNSVSGWNLDYMHARYYSPNLGRFLSVDPELDPEKIKYEPQQWNRYSYVVNNPLKYTDPDGKDKFMAWLLGSAFKDVSTWDALKGALTGQHAGPSMSQAAGDWAEDHRQMTGGFSPVPTSKTEVAMMPVLMMLGPGGKTAFNGVITSAIKNDTLLVKAAQVAGKSHQGSIDNLVGALAKGNLNPGIGSKNLFGNVMYARARDGARVFFRQGRDGSVEILAKANKANEKQVVKRLEELYR